MKDLAPCDMRSGVLVWLRAILLASDFTVRHCFGFDFIVICKSITWKYAKSSKQKTDDKRLAWELNDIAEQHNCSLLIPNCSFAGGGGG
jgi:hypothetical protein